MESPSREPDIEVEAEVLAQSGSLGMLPTRTWLPSHSWETHYVEILSGDFRHKDLLGQHLIVQAPLRSPGRPRGSAIVAQGLRIDSARLSFSDAPYRPAVALGGAAERLVVAEQRGSEPGGDESPSKLEFHLTDNSLLRPFENMSCRPDGNVSVAEQDGITLKSPELGDLVFNHQYYYTHNADGSTTIHRRLVCSAGVATDAVDVDSVLRTKLPFVRDVLLLASLAARERTELCGWNAESQTWKVAVYLGRGPHDDGPPMRRSVDWLIAPESFAEFLQQTVLTLEQLPLGLRRILQSASRHAVPARSSTLEQRYLASFAALESIAAWHKAESRFATNISGKGWAALLEALQRTIQENSGLFESDRHRKLLEKALPRIQQVPASEAFRSFFDDYRIDLRNVWPAYGKANGCSLADLRNRLAHGAPADNWHPEAMACAFRNLQVTLERSILAVLGWPIDRSHVSGSALSEVDWLDSQDLAGYQKLFRQRPGD